MTGKTWALPELDEIQVRNLAKQMGVSNAIASVYLVRGLDTQDRIEEFCNPNINELHDPYLLPDMAKAVDRIIEALHDNEKIIVIGDADCDGICATALIVYALRSMGADVIYRIPNRLVDGFGIQVSDVEYAMNNSVRLVITVDNGSEAYNASQMSNRLGIDLIISDNHECSSDGVLPSAFAVINPKRHDSVYPFDGLSGTGVAFKLMVVVAEKIGCNRESIIGQLIEFVALGTVADMMPMIDENRSLVSQGYQALTESTRNGIRALLNSTGIKQVDTTSIGFYIAPLINASARLGQPELAVELLLADDMKEAKTLAMKLVELNEERKKLQDEMTIDIMKSLHNGIDEPIVFSSGRNLHLGLIGLAANSMMNIRCRPAFICSIQDDGMVRGSCRSPQSSYGLIDVKVIQQEHQILTRLGGHAQAFGFELKSENLLLFKALLNKHFSEPYDWQNDFLEIDARMSFNEINMETYQQLTKLAPYGNGNQEPTFLTENLTIENSVAFGGGKHLKLQLKDSSGKNTINAIYWRRGNEIDQFQRSKIVDAVYKIGVNEFAGRREILLTIEDMQIAG